jgi:hypothetical protein
MSDRRFVAALFAVGFVFCWVFTSAPCLAFVNWDNGGFLSAIGSANERWSNWAPWNAHFAIQNVYWIGIWIVQPFGGTLIDGFRLGTSICFGLALAVIGEGARRLSGSRLLAALLGLTWMTAWVTFFLVLSLEDNILFLPSGAAVLCLCALRVDSWQWRHSLVAGVLAAAAALMSWQALLYLGPAFYAALVGGGRDRRALIRARDAALVIAAFFATLCLWILFIAATSRTQTVKMLWLCLFGRPTGRFDVRALSDVTGELHAIGVAGTYMIEHTAMNLKPFPLKPETVGAFMFVLALGAFAVATWASWRRRSWAPHVLAATLLLFLLVTPFYVDIDYRYLIRFDFLPIVVVLLLAMALRPLSDQRQPKLAVAVLLSLLIVAQTAGALRYQHQQRASYPTLKTWIGPHPPAAFYGREGQPFYAYFRALRRAHANACRYVLAQGEISEGSWNLDLMGSLWSELPEHVIVGDAAEMKRYRFPPRGIASKEGARFLDDGCSYVSDDARRMIAAAR